VAGATTILVTEKSERRVKMASELGADVVINVNESDPVQRVRELTGGSGLAVVFECTGNPQGLETMVELLPFYGQGVIVASYETPITIDYNTIMLKSLNLQGVLGMDNFFPMGASLIESGRVRVDPLYSSIVPLENINEAMMALLEGKEIGILIAP
jgi:threonine dehydrogenase-like Zn-dependent dehydrogenase